MTAGTPESIAVVRGWIADEERRRAKKAEDAAGRREYGRLVKAGMSAKGARKLGERHAALVHSEESS